MKRYYLPTVRAAEFELASLIKGLSNKICDKIEPVYGDVLSDTQTKAVDLACRSSISILRGLPGTGKTTTLRQVVASFFEAGMKGIVLCPSGKAAKRAEEVLNECKKDSIEPPTCHTIHSGLGWHDSGFEFCHDNYLPYDYVIIDEAPMMGLSIARSLFSAIDPRRTRIVLSGDTNQLPSVDGGNVIRDIIMSHIVPDTNLTTLFRQGKDSGIAYNAHRILRSKLPTTIHEETEVQFTDFFTAYREGPEGAREYIIDCVIRAIPEKLGYDPLRDIQVLSPGKRGAIGTFELNKKLREILNPYKTGQKSFSSFRVKDKVINKKNNKNENIVNGDVGHVIGVTNAGITVDFGAPSGRSSNGRVVFTADNVCNLQLAYAYTVHASQGSEFPCVILPVFKTHWHLLFRNLYYTAMTRPKKTFLQVVHKQALKRCVSNTVVDKRMTGLCELLKA